MNIFVPFPEFERCAAEMRPVDTIRTLRGAIAVCRTVHESAMSDDEYFYYKRHPLVNQWEHHVVLLCEYSLTCIETMSVALPPQREGFHVMQEEFEKHLEWETSGDYSLERPWWLGDNAFHAMQRSVLARFDPLYYGKKWDDVSYRIPEYWPSWQK